NPINAVIPSIPNQTPQVEHSQPSDKKSEQPTKDASTSAEDDTAASGNVNQTPQAEHSQPSDKKSEQTIKDASTPVEDDTVTSGITNQTPQAEHSQPSDGKCEQPTNGPSISGDDSDDELEDSRKGQIGSTVDGSGNDGPEDLSEDEDNDLEE
ncbi:hypothetical protein BGX34_008771, partial [Mortierella sp. NVP85]